MESKICFDGEGKYEHWETPQPFFDELDAEFGFTLDVAAAHGNQKCERYFTRWEDGLKQDWGEEVCWCNPPYGRVIAKWVRKAWESAQAGAMVVMLVPARTDTIWWHDYCVKGEIRFIRGRLTFSGAQEKAPFPSAVVIFRPQGGLSGEIRDRACRSAA